MIDLGTAGLLNDARQGRPAESTGGSDEALAAPSAVCVTDFAADDLEVVRLYLDLGRRHDELVDAVEKKLQEQAH